MSPWGYFAIITVGIAIAVGGSAVHDRRRADLAHHRYALAVAFANATRFRGGPHAVSLTAVDAMNSRGWTVSDLEGLGRALAQGVRGTGADLNEPIRARVADRAGRIFSALTETGLLGGSTVHGQMTWIALLAVHHGTEVLSPIVGAKEQSSSAVHWYESWGAPVSPWHDRLGSLAPYAIAAGFGLDEAATALSRGDLDVNVLMALAGLRGVVLPAPSGLLSEAAAA